MKEKRVFYKRGFEFRIVELPCEPYDLSMEELMDYLESFDEESYPVFLINLSMTGAGPWDFADQYCFDCRKSGGTTIKPDFWE